MRLEVLGQLHNLLARLVAELLLGRAQHLLQDGENRAGQALDDRVLLLVESDDHLENGLVLLVVLSKGKELDQDGEDVSKGDVVGVSLDHAGNTSSRVVEKTGLLLLVQQRLELGEDGVVLAGDLVFVGALLAEETGTIGGVATNLRVLVSKTLEEDLHQVGGVGSDGCTHVANGLGDGADSSTTLVLFGSADVLNDRLLEDLPELAERFAKGSSKAGDDLHGGLDNEPVVLG